jgi:hypothetical protein
MMEKLARDKHFSVFDHGATTFRLPTVSVTTLSIKGLNAKMMLIINDTFH